MDSSNAEQLTDVEREEVLRALAATLRWEAIAEGGFRAPLFTESGQPSGWYSVTTSLLSVRVSRTFWDSSVQAYPKGFASVQEAKAACARHYETYQWEAEHFHETVFREEQMPQ